MDEFFIFWFWLNENLPELFSVWISLNKATNWNKDKPFNFTNAKLNKTKGKDSKNLPPTASNRAKAIDIMKIENLTPLVSFLAEALAINLNNR